jgi:hypothetical protein
MVDDDIRVDCLFFSLTYRVFTHGSQIRTPDSMVGYYTTDEYTYHSGPQVYWILEPTNGFHLDQGLLPSRA